MISFWGGICFYTFGAVFAVIYWFEDLIYLFEDNGKYFLIFLGVVIFVLIVASILSKVDESIAELITNGILSVFLVLIGGVSLIALFGLVLNISFDGGGGGYEEYEDSDDYEHPGYHYVDDYYRSDGTHVEGHWKTNPDEYEWNNLSD